MDLSGYSVDDMVPDLPLQGLGGTGSRLRDFVEHVVPELQRRGLTKTKYEGRTLRENLN